MNLSEWNFCGRKIAYEKLTNANRAIKSLIRQKKTKDGDMNAYRCPRCDKFHIGHIKKKTQDLLTTQRD